jgi:hypothetical protein
MKSAIDTAMEEAVQESKIEIARNALSGGASGDFVADITGLSSDIIEKLRQELEK